MKHRHVLFSLLFLIMASCIEKKHTKLIHSSDFQERGLEKTDSFRLSQIIDFQDWALSDSFLIVTGGRAEHLFHCYDRESLQFLYSRGERGDAPSEFISKSGKEIEIYTPGGESVGKVQLGIVAKSMLADVENDRILFFSPLNEDYIYYSCYISE